jgi:hypothetical protein
LCHHVGLACSQLYLPFQERTLTRAKILSVFDGDYGDIRAPLRSKDVKISLGQRSSSQLRVAREWVLSARFIDS